MAKIKIKFKAKPLHKALTFYLRVNFNRKNRVAHKTAQKFIKFLVLNKFLDNHLVNI
jgi:hypothetical protein